MASGDVSMQKGKSKDPNNEEPRRSTRFPGISQLLRSPMDHYSDHSRASVVDFPSKKIQDASQVQRLLSVPDTDGDELLQLLCRRSTEQRMEINCEFKKLFESDISAEIKRAIPKDSELRRLLLFLVTPNDEYLAQELWDALCDAKNVDLRTIIGIMGTHKWQDLQKIRCAYFRRFQRSLEKDLVRVKNPLRCGLLHILRNEVDNRPVDMNKTKKHSAFLGRSTIERGEETTKVFMQAACKYGFAHMRVVDLARQKINFEPIADAAQRLLGGNEGALVATRFRIALDEPAYYAETLRNSCQGMSTDHATVIRIVAGRSSIDMQDIKVAFRNKYHQTLEQWLRGGTVGFYQDGLVRLTHGNRAEVDKLTLVQKPDS
ncbi:annexin A4-like [Varroa destructor]|uniref:Annexin n=1 Tax=Varroa destructor TaxID=109461 RepID=A0A7M7JKQ4_VARDE|nr:annexin A4-like [Varroa destructor]XP_022653155.1 annexin A4-like [Varroa destructor]XP_022653156.1 annexin A4-like [Varroa destructor]